MQAVRVHGCGASPRCVRSTDHFQTCTGVHCPEKRPFFLQRLSPWPLRFFGDAGERHQNTSARPQQNYRRFWDRRKEHWRCQKRHAGSMLTNGFESGRACWKHPRPATGQERSHQRRYNRRYAQQNLWVNTPPHLDRASATRVPNTRMLTRNT